ncbi:oligopeptidase F [Kushneria sinocarnis]|uniref:Oligopeptidase F n=1 Tax=Kushneria sinocarnis TaxID=595502 RepID=A0A420WXL6_9GAMM|nr:oligoendopeptidase F [Kushneria sinocarnis]RKR04499.1 oligopeptidase F [Kushneria sinocarnis]
MHYRTARLLPTTTLLLALLPGVTSPVMAAQASRGTSNDGASAGTWQLEDLYASPAAWQQSYEQVSQAIDGLDRFRGHLTDSPQALAEALDAVRLNAYASLRADEDLRNSTAQERNNRATRLMAHYGEVTGYIRPELTGMDQSTLAEWAARPVLKVHRRFLENVMREAPHTLARPTESALAALAPVTTTGNTYSLLTNSDIAWPSLAIDGKSRTLDQAGYSRWRESEDRDVRRRVFETFWPVWQQYETTFGALLGNQVLEHVIEARLRHYDSALAAAVSSNDIPAAVYHQLIRSANQHLPTLHRYLKLRQRMLGVEQLHYYDIYPPLVTSERRFTIDDARRLTRAATRPLGAHYSKLLERATDSPWTSVYPQRGKRSGAYMNGSAYDVHPYVLMNFNGAYGDVSTYAHEWGHGIHSMLADESQPYATSDYPIFTAEVASTTNEELLIDDMIRQADNDREKLFYIGQALESLRGTFFRQTQFAEFELAIHEAAEQGTPLSGKRMTQMYGDILKKYYGVEQGVTAINPDFFIEWAYIPHFYYNFYVYQYATSITAAHHFASALKRDPEKVRATYLNVLSSGGSDSGYRLLKQAGVDLATPQPYDALMDYMNELMDQAETLLERS